MHCTSLDTPERDRVDLRAARAVVREVGELFVDTETRLAVIDRDGMIATGNDDGPRVRLDEWFDAATATEVRELLAGTESAPSAAVRVVRGRSIDNRDVIVRILRSELDTDYWLVLVRPFANAATERARDRVRELTAALQAVADIVVPLQELHGHEDARRRAALVASLTDRERRVALAVADGVRTSQIANDLYVSQSTVRNYLPTIYRKLGVESRTALVELLNSPD